MTRQLALAGCTAALVAVVSVGSMATGSVAQAGPTPGNLAEEVHQLDDSAVQTNILRDAEQFPADKYTWQPTPDVRS